MIFPDVKKTATMILSKGDKNMEAKPEEDLSKDSDGLQSAADDVMQAIQDKSRIDLKNALKSFFEIADNDDSESEGDEEGFH